MSRPPQDAEGPRGPERPANHAPRSEARGACAEPRDVFEGCGGKADRAARREARAERKEERAERKEERQDRKIERLERALKRLIDRVRGEEAPPPAAPCPPVAPGAPAAPPTFTSPERPVPG